MHVYTLSCEMVTRSSLKETFSVFQDPYNLAKITPPWMAFEVTSKDKVIMQAGAEIEYRIRWMSLPIHWKTIIRAYRPPFFFVDEQAKGPYSLWRHRHTFASTPHGTQVSDHVEYALPFGPLGRVAHSLAVRKQLKQIFDYRQDALAKLLDGDSMRTKEPVIIG